MLVWAYTVWYKTVMQAVFLLVSYNMCFPMWNFQKAVSCSEAHILSRIVQMQSVFFFNFHMIREVYFLAKVIPLVKNVMGILYVTFHSSTLFHKGIQISY